MIKPINNGKVFCAMIQTILQKALKIRELQVSLENIAHDDKRIIETYTDDEILAEAKYVLSTFNEGGHQNNDELICEHGDKDAQRAARNQVTALKRLLASGEKANTLQVKKSSFER